MRILLTNDDGFFAPGLQILHQVLAHQHELYVVAPEGQRSAIGHSITLFEPLMLTKHALTGDGLGFAVRGTPSDCVKLAVQGELIPRPDLVISGINNGQNLGTDVFYSGTVSAAMEGVLLGIPSIAVSLASYDFEDFHPAAEFINQRLTQLAGICDRGLLNINIPGTPANEWKGLLVTRLGKTVYKDVFSQYTDPRGRSFYWQGGTLQLEEQEGTDLWAVSQGYVAITPLHSDLTDYAKLDKLRKALTKPTV